jgi:hypothetical protein
MFMLLFCMREERYDKYERKGRMEVGVVKANPAK